MYYTHWSLVAPVNIVNIRRKQSYNSRKNGKFEEKPKVPEDTLNAMGKSNNTNSYLSSG
jgi:hypothetical protein